MTALDKKDLHVHTPFCPHRHTDAPLEAYLAAADATADPCLRELYLELAEDENAHGWMLRGMLEKM